MKRALLIAVSLCLAVAGWSMVCAQDFYVVPVTKANYAPVAKTGQTDSYSAAGTDGALQKGVAWPSPRFTDNGNGTVTDKLTGLIWMKNANGFNGTKTWDDALSAANNLASGSAGLMDGSKAGDWRLPNVRELQSLIDYGFYGPALPNTQGTGQWSEGNPFQGVQSDFYWSSTTNAGSASTAWSVYFNAGSVGNTAKSNSIYVWCVRGGR
jgi:hypothetical protein